MATRNPILLRILTEDLGMCGLIAQGQLKRNKLTLYGEFDAVTDDIVIAISKNWPELTSVDLRMCRRITDTAVLSLAENCRGLTVISLDSCPKITDRAVIALATNCAGMTNINLSYCSSITNAGVIAIAENCAGLEVISLSMCMNITDAAIIALAVFCWGLSSIDLSACGNITDDAVIALADGCMGLTWINVSRCKNITDAAIIALANCKYLQYCSPATHGRRWWWGDAIVGNGNAAVALDPKVPKVTATGRALIKEINTRPKLPPLEKGWWLDMDDGIGPRCKGMMN